MENMNNVNNDWWLRQSEEGEFLKNVESLENFSLEKLKEYQELIVKKIREKEKEKEKEKFKIENKELYDKMQEIDSLIGEIIANHGEERVRQGIKYFDNILLLTNKRGKTEEAKTEKTVAKTEADGKGKSVLSRIKEIYEPSERFTVAQLSKDLNKSSGYLSVALSSLLERGELKREFDGRKYYYWYE